LKDPKYYEDQVPFEEKLKKFIIPQNQHAKYRERYEVALEQKSLLDAS
jgi:hypothetical protein